MSAMRTQAAGTGVSMPAELPYVDDVGSSEFPRLQLVSDDFYSRQRNNSGRLSVGTDGHVYIGVGSGISISPATGSVGINVGGITLPVGR